MRLPNGYGSVYRLNGNRRNPWAARVTVAWNEKGHPVYKFVGYYPSKAEALQALANYNNNPYLITDMTLKELHDLWYDSVNLSKSNTLGVNSAWKVCKPLESKKIKDLRLPHFQTMFDQSGKNAPSLTKVKTLLSMMYEYAVKNEYVSKDKHDIIKYIEIRAGNPNAIERKPFTKEEISNLWKSDDEYASVILMLIYSGLRIGEMLNLKCEDVHLDERYLNVVESKTSAGIREVPIAEKMVKFYAHWLNKGNEYLIGEEYYPFYRYHWQPLTNHRPHDTRHTFVSLMVEAGEDERIIKKIVGHKGYGVTDTVYTHLDLPRKIEAVNKICF